MAASRRQSIPKHCRRWGDWKDVVSAASVGTVVSQRYLHRGPDIRRGVVTRESVEWNVASLACTDRLRSTKPGHARASPLADCGRIAAKEGEHLRSHRRPRRISMVSIR